MLVGSLPWKVGSILVNKAATIWVVDIFCLIQLFWHLYVVSEPLVGPPEYYILFPLDFCAKFPVRHIFYLILFLMLNLATGNTWVSLLVHNFSYSICCRHISWCFPWQDSVFYRSSGKNLPLSLGPFVPPFQIDWRICQCAEFLQCFSILEAANSAWLQVISLPFWYWWNLTSGYLYWKAILKSIFSTFPWDWQVVWVSKGSV